MGLELVLAFTALAAGAPQDVPARRVLSYTAVDGTTVDGRTQRVLIEVRCTAPPPPPPSPPGLPSTVSTGVDSGPCAPDTPPMADANCRRIWGPQGKSVHVEELGARGLRCLNGAGKLVPVTSQDLCGTYATLAFVQGRGFFCAIPNRAAEAERLHRLAAAPTPAPPPASQGSDATRQGVAAWERGDYTGAVRIWRPAATAGDADSQYNLGQAYKLGRGVPQDLVQAEQWYRRAAEQGHPQGSDSYGLALFANGKRSDAVYWLRGGARRGDARAQFVLGTMYFNGEFVAKDWPRAYALISRAQDSGLPEAGRTLAQMERFLSAADRQAGLELARGGPVD